MSKGLPTIKNKFFVLVKYKKWLIKREESLTLIILKIWKNYVNL